jgi:hypothetical protein
VRLGGVFCDMVFFGNSDSRWMPLAPELMLWDFVL